jgi:putative hydrolase of the HAD superfamily
MAVAVPRGLVEGVRMLCLDAGNTVIFLDHARLAKLANEGGENVSAARLVVAEGEMKRALETGGVVDVDWKDRGAPGAVGWGRAIATMLVKSGVPVANVAPLLEMIWQHHKRLNLWSVVPAGFNDAMSRIRALGVKVVLVSNSEGMLAELFDELGILESFDLLLDSGKVGVEKPDPRIFQLGLERYGVRGEQALHLGDTYATDVLGARAAGVRTALIDPHGHYEGVHVDVPRVPGAVEVAHAIAEAANVTR